MEISLMPIELQMQPYKLKYFKIDSNWYNPFKIDRFKTWNKM